MHIFFYELNMEASKPLKRPPGPVPRGAIWVEGEGYRYTEEYFDIREKALKRNRAVSYENQKERMKRLKQARPHLWKQKKRVGTLDPFVKETNVDRRTDENLRTAQFSVGSNLQESFREKGDSSEAERPGGICEEPQ